jgi:tetratricopeptide (TPR) repeat protein
MKSVNRKLEQQANVHDLLKKANRSYQLGHIDASILAFNEVLKLEPNNTIAKYFIKFKKDQFKEEIRKSPTEQIHLSLFIINREYKNAYKILSRMMKTQLVDKNYIELHRLITNKLSQKMQKKIGDLSMLYLATDLKPINLSVEENQIYKQFRTASPLDQVIQVTPMNNLLALNVLDKLINQRYISQFIVTDEDLFETNEQLLDQDLSIEIEEEDYDSLFKQATAAYVRRNFAESIQLYHRCLQINPNDSRAIHNINKLEERNS